MIWRKTTSQSLLWCSVRLIQNSPNLKDFYSVLFVRTHLFCSSTRWWKETRGGSSTCTARLVWSHGRRGPRCSLLPDSGLRESKIVTPGTNSTCHCVALSLCFSLSHSLFVSLGIKPKLQPTKQVPEKCVTQSDFCIKWRTAAQLLVSSDGYCVFSVELWNAVGIEKMIQVSEPGSHPATAETDFQTTETKDSHRATLTLNLQLFVRTHKRLCHSELVFWLWKGCPSPRDMGSLASAV